MKETQGISFNNVAKNAFDFMKRALVAIESDPKSSVIFFWTALELFLKARLLNEHWSLILTDPRDAEQGKFREGDFVSVSFNTAVKRLKKVCGLKVAGSENPCFKEIKDHRNRLVHFYMPGYSVTDTKKVLDQIASEQCRGWYFLHKWLTEEWEAEFKTFDTEIKSIHNLVRLNRKFLKAKLEGVKVDLEKLKNKGNRISNCFVCGYTSLVEVGNEKHNDLSITHSECRVCGYYSGKVIVPCNLTHNCTGTITFGDLSAGRCDKCSEELDTASLVEMYGEPDNEYGEANAYCCSCDYSELRSVIPFSDDRHLCIACLTIHEGLDNCENCGTRITSGRENTYWNGCAICEGFEIPDD